MPAENKVGDIFLNHDEFVCRAFWRPLDGSPEVLLCSMHVGTYERHPAIRELFANLAADIAINLDRPAGSGITVQHVPVKQPTDSKIDRSRFACWTCTHVQAVEACHHLSAFADADLAAHLTPAGNPMFCCRVAG
jgi:hypothetical protein